MAIAMNGGNGDEKQQLRRHNCDGQRRRQRNGRRDGGAIAMAMGNSGEKSTWWKMAVAVVQLQWARTVAAQWMAGW